MSLAAEDMPPPAAGEAQLRQTAIGFNYIDVYQRKGIYPLPLPTGLGFEATGVVEAVGPGVGEGNSGDIKVGNRAAYMNAGVGAYADRRNVPANRLVVLPDAVGDDAAASLFFKGMTAQYLVRKTHVVQPGDVLLVHSAAGGVGQILARWATALGAIVIGTTGSPQKKAAALAAGCKAVVDLNDAEWPKAVLEATGGKKARVVYDAVGKDTLLKSLDCAAPFGARRVLRRRVGAGSGHRAGVAQQEGLLVSDEALGVPAQCRCRNVSPPTPPICSMPSPRATFRSTSGRCFPSTRWSPRTRPPKPAGSSARSFSNRRCATVRAREPEDFDGRPRPARPADLRSDVRRPRRVQ